MMVEYPMDHVVADLRDDLFSYISDASKDSIGCRMRADINRTTASLMIEADFWSERVAASIEEDRLYANRAVACMEKSIQRAIEVGAGDRATALRWLIESEDPDWMPEWEQDVESWAYSHGVLFTEYGRKLVDEVCEILGIKG